LLPSLSSLADEDVAHRREFFLVLAERVDAAVEELRALDTPTDPAEVVSFMTMVAERRGMTLPSPTLLALDAQTIAAEIPADLFPVACARLWARFAYRRLPEPSDFLAAVKEELAERREAAAKVSTGALKVAHARWLEQKDAEARKRHAMRIERERVQAAQERLHRQSEAAEQAVTDQQSDDADVPPIKGQEAAVPYNLDAGGIAPDDVDVRRVDVGIQDAGQTTPTTCPTIGRTGAPNISPNNGLVDLPPQSKMQLGLVVTSSLVNPRRLSPPSRLEPTYCYRSQGRLWPFTESRRNPTGVVTQQPPRTRQHKLLCHIALRRRLCVSGASSCALDRPTPFRCLTVCGAVEGDRIQRDTAHVFQIEEACGHSWPIPAYEEDYWSGGRDRSVMRDLRYRRRGERAYAGLNVKFRRTDCRRGCDACLPGNVLNAFNSLGLDALGTLAVGDVHRFSFGQPLKPAPPDGIYMDENVFAVLGQGNELRGC